MKNSVVLFKENSMIWNAEKASELYDFIGQLKIKKGEIKVTVIATSFPADMPRKNLFSGTSILSQTLLKEENAEKAILVEIKNINIRLDNIEKGRQSADLNSREILVRAIEKLNKSLGFLNRKLGK